MLQSRTVRIAVIGTGVAGLGAAHALRPAHEVELFERNGYAGGHTHTVDVVDHGRALAVDTGFIVHNGRNYPQLVGLLAELGVRVQETTMSFSVSCAGCGLELSGRVPLLPLANLRRPRQLRFLRDVARFQRTAERALDALPTETTLAGFARREGYGDDLTRHWLVPLCAAIWSLEPRGALELPARYALGFLANHGVLGFRHLRWRTVVGGSREYVGALLARCGAPLHLERAVTAVERGGDGVVVRTADGEGRRFDRVVVATHPDQALALLAEPTADERRILGAFSYSRNEAVLHTDELLLPRRRIARAAWNYHLPACEPGAGAATLTYSMNRLQRLDAHEEWCVTLNRGAAIREDRVVRRIVYEHPRFTVETLAAQAELGSLNGPNRTAFCGAYAGYGFHEDGLVSGLAAARATLEAAA